MTTQHGIKRKAHFLGTKIKQLRKRNKLTLEDLSVRCVQIDAEAGPSVSYLSLPACGWLKVRSGLMCW